MIPAAFIRALLYAGCLLALWTVQVPLRAQPCSTVANGALNDPATWSCGCLPQTCDTLVIAHALTHAGNANLAINMIHVAPTGSLTVAGHLTVSANVQCDGSMTADTLEFISNDLLCNGSIVATDLRLRNDSTWNMGAITGTDTLEIGSYNELFNQGDLAGGHARVLGQLYNQGNAAFAHGLAAAILVNTGTLTGHGAFACYSFFENMPGAVVDVDSLFLFGNGTNQGTLATDSAFHLGNAFTDGDLLNTSAGLILCRNDFFNNGILHGAGHVCIAGHSENHGALNGIIDVCDATPGMSVPPYLDVNDGTSSASLNHCADGFCASLGLPEQGTYALTPFPDPATEQLHLAWSATEPPHTLLLLDALGREVMRQPWPRDGRVFVAALPTGVYHTLAIGPAGAVLGRARVVKE